MLLRFKGRLFSANFSKGKAYCTFNDVEQQGLFNLTIPGAKDLRIDGLYEVEAEIKPGIYEGKTYLTVVDLKSVNNEVKEK